MTQVKCPKSYKSYFTVIKKVKKAHEINDYGENQVTNSTRQNYPKKKFEQKFRQLYVKPTQNEYSVSVWNKSFLNIWS